MKKKTRWPVNLVIFIGLLTTIVLLVWFGITRIPNISDQIPDGASSIEVSITHPQNQTGWPSNYSIPVDVTAYSSEPIDHIDLYINGVLYESKKIKTNSENKIISAQWRWQPGNSGMYVLTAYAVGVNSNSNISTPIVIESSSPISTGSPIQIHESTTLEKIAETNNISLIDLQNANPEAENNQPVESGEIIFLPNPPDPVENQIIPAINPESDPISYPYPGQSSNQEENTSEPPDWSKINDLWFFLKSKFQKPEIQEDNNEPDIQIEENEINIEPTNPNQVVDSSMLPDPIDIYGNVEGCNVNLYVAPTYNFEGVFVYRSKDGASFERIAKIPHYTGDQSVLHITDENQSGIVVYYAAAFNTYGENPGPAKTFALNSTCENNGLNIPHIETAWLEDNGDLSLATNLDTAYLYVQINDSIAERVPDHDRMFLPNSGTKFNLNSYLETRDDLMEMTDFSVHMEVWGWQGDDLVYAGNLDHEIHRSMLLVCDTEGEGKCHNGALGNWSTEMTILPNIYKPLNEQKYELRWLSSQYSYTNKICIRIGDRFTGPGLHDSMPTILNLCFGSNTTLGEFENNEGTYLLNFGEILYHDNNPKYPVYNGINDNYQEQNFSKRIPMGEPFTLAIRVKPLLADNDLNDVSNTVYMHHLSPYENEDLPPLESTVPSLYDVEILKDTYQLQEYEIPGRWACVIIDANPPSNHYVGQEVCPLTYVECGKNVECEDSGFFGLLEAAWNMIADAYNDAKEEISGAIVNTIPFCDDSNACKKAIRAGVDYGTTYLTGMPPNLPNADELVSEGVSTVIEGELNDIGIDPQYGQFVCGDSCKAEITSQVNKILEEKESYYSQPGCYDLGGHYGYFPECFSPPTVVHPVYGAGDFPGSIIIRVTRKSTPESLEADDVMLSGKTQLWLTVDGENSNRIGYYRNSCFYTDNIPQDQLPDPNNPSSNANHGLIYMGDEPMQGELYKPVKVDLPWIEPGESVDIAIPLYVFHNSAKQPCISTAKSQYLFYRGTSHMEAAEYCLSEDSSQLWVPCTNGGLDIWDYQNPTEPGQTSWIEDAAAQASDVLSGN